MSIEGEDGSGLKYVLSVVGEQGVCDMDDDKEVEYGIAGWVCEQERRKVGVVRVRGQGSRMNKNKSEEGQ